MKRIQSFLGTFILLSLLALISCSKEELEISQPDNLPEVEDSYDNLNKASDFFEFNTEEDTIAARPIYSCSRYFSSVITSQGPCNDNGTPEDDSDDYFEASVKIKLTLHLTPFDGKLLIYHGSTLLASKEAVDGLNKISGLKLPANDRSVILEAKLSWVACKHSIIFSPVSPCSVLPKCSMTWTGMDTTGCYDAGTPDDTSDDYFRANITVDYSDAPYGSGCEIVLEAIDPVSIGTLSGGSRIAEPYGGSSHTFGGIILPADGTSYRLKAYFSCDPTCFEIISVLAPGPCSTTTCDISMIVDPGVCNDNGTPSDPSDDYFMATVIVEYVDFPGCEFTLEADGTPILSSFGADRKRKHIFHIRLPITESPTQLKVYFLCAPECEANVIILPIEPCACGVAQTPRIKTTETTADITFDNSNDNQFRIVYKKVGDTSWRVKTTYGKQITLSRLTRSRTYDYKLQEVCDGTRIEVASGTFRTK